MTECGDRRRWFGLRPAALPGYLTRAARRGLATAAGLLLGATVIVFAAAAQDAGPASRTESQPQQRRVVIRFLTEGDFPPFNYLDDEGVLAGFNVDLARALCLELSAACDIKVRPWDELFLGLKRGEADAVIAGHSVTARALADVEFTNRYFYTPGRFAGRIGGPAVEIDPNALEGRIIGVAKGTPHEAYLKSFFRDSKIQPFENAELAREALMQNKVDLVFDDGVSLAFWLNGTLSRQCCEMRGGPYLEPKYFGDGIAIAVPKGDAQIKTLLNVALDRVRKSGRFEELVGRYFPQRVF